MMRAVSVAMECPNPACGAVVKVGRGGSSSGSADHVDAPSSSSDGTNNSAKQPDSRRAVCPDCGEALCAQCGEAWHGKGVASSLTHFGRACDEYKRALDGLSSAAPDRGAFWASLAPEYRALVRRT